MVATYAKVTVTQGLSGTVTIAVEGEAGQIGVGTSNWPNYDYSTVITESYKKLIKNAKHLVITGNVNSTDMAALVGKNANGNNWTLEELDMSRAMLVVPLDQNVEDHSPPRHNRAVLIDILKIAPPLNDLRARQRVSLFFHIVKKEVTRGDLLLKVQRNYAESFFLPR